MILTTVYQLRVCKTIIGTLTYVEHDGRYLVSGVPTKWKTDDFARSFSLRGAFPREICIYTYVRETHELEFLYSLITSFYSPLVPVIRIIVSLN